MVMAYFTIALGIGLIGYIIYGTYSFINIDREA